MTTPRHAPRAHATTIDPSTLPALISGHRSALVFLGTAEPEAGRAEPGDLVYLDAGQVFAGARVARVDAFRDLNAHELRLLRETHGSRTIGDGSVWSSRPDARFATVIWLAEVRPLEDRSAVPDELARSREAWRSLAPSVPARRAA